MILFNFSFDTFEVVLSDIINAFHNFQILIYTY